jgi:hypothetical protein
MKYPIAVKLMEKEKHKLYSEIERWREKQWDAPEFRKHKIFRTNECKKIVLAIEKELKGLREGVK